MNNTDIQPPSPRLTSPPMQHFSAPQQTLSNFQPMSPTPAGMVPLPNKMQHLFHTYAPAMLHQPSMLQASMKQQQQALSEQMNNGIPMGLLPPNGMPHHHHPHHPANMLGNPPIMPSPTTNGSNAVHHSSMRNSTQSKKRKINKLACQYCSKLHKKCDGDSPHPCSRCHAKGVECVYVQRAKRGPKTKRQKQNGSPSNPAPHNATPASPLLTDSSSAMMASLEHHQGVNPHHQQAMVHHLQKQAFSPNTSTTTNLQNTIINRVPLHPQQQQQQSSMPVAPTPPPSVYNNLFSMFQPPAPTTDSHHSAVQNYPFLSTTPHPFYPPLHTSNPASYTPTPTSNNNNWATLPAAASFSQTSHATPILPTNQWNQVSSANGFPFMQPLDLSSFNLPTLTSSVDNHPQDAFPSVVPDSYDEHDDAFHRQ